MSKTAIMLRGEEGGGEGPAGGNFVVAVVVPGFCLTRSRSWLDSPCDRPRAKYRMVKREKLILAISPLADCFHLLIGLFYLA
jgi:hypothetical protein